MIAKIFRAVDSDGKPTGYRGFALGNNLLDVFHAIDEFIDPYTVEVASIHATGMCFYLEEDECDAEKHEVSEVMAICYDQDRRWTRIDWTKLLDDDLTALAIHKAKEQA
jgi:hypothetical protein